MAPRVSILIPAYQAEAHLTDALDSLVAQTFEDWEALVCDDGSTDATVEIAERYAPRVRALRGSINQGPSAARNRGLAESRGELIALLDSDDWWEPTYLAEQVALYDAEQARDGRVGVVCCDARMVGPYGELHQSYGERWGRPVPPVTAADLLRFNTIYGSAMAPSTLVKSVGGFDPRIWGGEEFDIWLQIVERGYRVVYNPKPLAVYRLGPHTLSRDQLKMVRGRQDVFRKALARGRLNREAERVAHAALRYQHQLEVVELLRQASARSPSRALVTAVAGGPTLSRVVGRRIHSMLLQWRKAGRDLRAHRVEARSSDSSR